MKKKIWFGITALVVLVVVLGAKWWHDNRDDLTVELPNYPPANKPVWMPQNWTSKQRDWFYHADQGTQTFGIPYEWFIALEQPALSFSDPGLLSDSMYLDRFGFISDTSSVKPELPIGFAHGSPLKNTDGTPVLNPQTKIPMTSLGLTCAACHTGRFTYQKTAVIVDGGSALTNVKNFQKAVGLSIVYTHLVPGRLARFADRVLGPGASDGAKSSLSNNLMPSTNVSGRSKIWKHRSKLTPSPKVLHGSMLSVALGTPSSRSTSTDTKILWRIPLPCISPASGMPRGLNGFSITAQFSSQ